MANIISSSGIDTSDGTATGLSVEEGKVFYSKGRRFVGMCPRITDAIETTPTYIRSTRKIELSEYRGEGGFIEYGYNITMQSDASNFGNATAADVAKGKTFTSTAGLKVAGTLTGQSSKPSKSEILRGNGTRRFSGGWATDTPKQIFIYAAGNSSITGSSGTINAVYYDAEADFALIITKDWWYYYDTLSNPAAPTVGARYIMCPSDTYFDINLGYVIIFRE